MQISMLLKCSTIGERSKDNSLALPYLITYLFCRSHTRSEALFNHPSLSLFVSDNVTRTNLALDGGQPSLISAILHTLTFFHSLPHSQMHTLQHTHIHTLFHISHHLPHSLLYSHIHLPHFTLSSTLSQVWTFHTLTFSAKQAEHETAFHMTAVVPLHNAVLALHTYQTSTAS